MKISATSTPGSPAASTTKRWLSTRQTRARSPSSRWCASSSPFLPRPRRPSFLCRCRRRLPSRRNNRCGSRRLPRATCIPKKGVSMVRFATTLLAVLILAAGSAYGAAKPRVDLNTSAGKIRLELYPVAAPQTVENFLAYVKSKQYDGTQFHRVIQGFMIQGGGFTPAFVQKPASRPPLKNEAEQSSKSGLLNVLGTIAMPRTGDPNSATTQFFINVADNK